MHYWNDLGSMITLRQIEALQWIVMLGTFDRAARRLGLTQSAISKRIHELEAATGITLFDRSGRGAHLTPEGGRVLAMGREMLSMRERIVQIGTQNSRPRRLVRLGITELTALTWLPRLMGALRASGSADIDIKPEVGLSRHLFRELVHGNLDLIVIPEVFSDPAVSSIRLAEVHNAWMASPQLVTKQKTYSLEELRALTILLQGLDSGSGAYYDRWLKKTGAIFERVLLSNSLIALVGLVVAGLGITYLPTLSFSRMVDEGKLMIVPTKLVLPPVPYAAMMSNARKDNACDEIVLLMEKSCDFSSQYQL